MTWRFIGTTSEPLTGIGEGPFTDAEFEAAVARYEAQFSAEQAGAVKASGLYKHEATAKGFRVEGTGTELDMGTRRKPAETEA